MDTQTDTRANTRSTLLVMICTFVSRLLGFVRTAVITAIYGASGTADVINLTFAVPNNLRKLLAEGALSSAFIPVLSETLVTEKDKAVPRKLVRNIITFQLLILVPLCVLSMAFARPLIVFILTRFTDPEQIELAVRLFRWFINYLLLISVSAAMMGILNSHGRFFLPAFTPILFSVAVISFILGLEKEIGVLAIAIGVIVGGIAQIAVQYPLFKRLGYDFVPDFSFKTERFKRIMKQWLPVMVTSSIFIITEQVSFRFASGLAEGSASAVSNALVFWQLPFGIFSASITTVLFPQMSRQAALKDADGLRTSIQYGLKFLLVLLVPSGVVLSFFGKEIIAVAYQRGLFTKENTLMTAQVLTGYCTGLFFVGGFNFLQRFFYANHDFAIPFYASLVLGILDIVLSYVLIRSPLAVTGISAANSISFTVGFFILLFYTWRSLGHIRGREILSTLLKVCVAMLPLIAFFILFKRIAGPWWTEGSSLKNLGLLAAGGLASVAITLGMYAVLRIEILSMIFKRRNT